MTARQQKGEKMGKQLELTLTVLMGPNQANISGNIHGGEIMKLMDNTAGALAVRYSKSNVVTARVDELQFLKPVFVGAYVTCTGKIAYVGRTSMEIFLTVDVENLRSDTGKYRALEAFFTMVAVGKDGAPCSVPPYTPETEDEKRLYDKIERRRERHRGRRAKK
jgi:acyl-CoA hydrolase